MNTKLFLSGGGNENDSFKIDMEFITSLKHKRIIYIPLALEPTINGYESCFDWISSTFSYRLTGDFVDISMWINLQNKTLADLNNFDAVYIGGGNTFNLLKKVKETAFDKILINFYKNGGIIYGGSAGAIICGHDINTVKEENEINYSKNDGLNLINNYSIICHYTKEQKNKVFSYVKENGIQVIAIPEKSGLVVEDGKKVTVVGHEPVYLFKINSTVGIIGLGQEVTI